MGTENKSATVFIIVWRLTEHRGHLDLLLDNISYKALDDRKEIYYTAQS